MHSGKPVSTTSDCCNCGGGGTVGDWDIEPPPDRDGAYLVATPCPGVTPVSSRVLVFIPRGTAQPHFTCTTFKVDDRCYSIGNTSVKVIDPLSGDRIEPGPNLGGDEGKSCCECRDDCGTSTVEVYTGDAYCDPHDRVYKKCCCGCKRIYSLTTSTEEKSPVFLSDGTSPVSGRWDYNTITVTRHVDAEWNNCGSSTTGGGVETISRTEKLWVQHGAGNWVLETTTSKTEESYLPSGQCQPLEMTNGLECGISTTIPGGYGHDDRLVQARHDCKEHTGAVVIRAFDQDSVPGRPHGPDYFFTYTFTSTIETTDNGCSGGCQGGTTLLPRSMLGMTPAEILEALG